MLETTHTLDGKFVREDEIGYLEGKILTLIDGSLADPTQRSAVKSLAKTMIRDWFARLRETDIVISSGMVSGK